MTKRLSSEVSRYLLACLLDGLAAYGDKGGVHLGGNSIDGMTTRGLRARSSNCAFDPDNVRSALMHMENAGLIEATWHLTAAGRDAQKPFADKVSEVLDSDEQERMNREHAQQHNDEYLASCQECVNEMRMECIEFLAHQAGEDNSNEAVEIMRSLRLRIDASDAYLRHTTFTDEDEADGDEQERMKDTNERIRDEQERILSDTGEPATGDDIHAGHTQRVDPKWNRDHATQRRWRRAPAEAGALAVADMGYAMKQVIASRLLRQMRKLDRCFRINCATHLLANVTSAWAAAD